MMRSREDGQSAEREKKRQRAKEQPPHTKEQPGIRHSLSWPAISSTPALITDTRKRSATSALYQHTAEPGKTLQTCLQATHNLQ